MPWSPSVNAYTDPGLFADCDDVGQVTSGSFVPLTCTVVIDANLMPNSEPVFRLILNSEDQEISIQLVF